jgi:hypothetical protein
MTLAQIAALLFEPRETRYVGRHRAADESRVRAVARVPLSAVPMGAVPMGAGATPATD